MLRYSALALKTVIASRVKLPQPITSRLPNLTSTHSLTPQPTSPIALLHYPLLHDGRPPAQVHLPLASLPVPANTPPPRFNQQVLIDTTPLPASIPPVKEIGASSAPLLSASFFIGDRCKAFNDDYMVCKTQAHGKGEIECMREGRKATRCAASV